MISYLRGKLLKKGEDWIILDVQGVGYKLSIPSRVQDHLPSTGDIVEFYTYTYVREDNLALFGFLEEEDLLLFEELVKVSGIGPKVGLNILSAMPASQFKLAVLQEKTDTLTRVNGIGKKTAQRLILELKGRIDRGTLIDDGSIPAAAGDSRLDDLVNALENLGYSSTEIQRAIKRVSPEEQELEAMLRQALKFLAAH